MERVELKSGPAIVVASGTVIAFDGNPVEIHFGPLEDQLILVWEFKDDKEKQEARFDIGLVDQRTLKLTLVNFNNPLGIGTVKPIQLGTLAGKPLSVHLRVYPLTNSDKTIHYTIYVSEEAARDGK